MAKAEEAAEEYRTSLASLKALEARQQRVLEELNRERELSEMRHRMALRSYLALALGEERDEYAEGEEGEA